VAETRIPRQVPSFRLERLDQDLLLYHPGLTKTVHLNPTASLIWQLCDGRRSVDEIAALLREAYDENAADITGDVESTLTRLADEGAVSFE
jgi:hypothetical protein